MGRLITLLTDFGTQDVYVGVMKGVMASLCPAARIIDLTHHIPPQDLHAARFNLLNSVPYFPQDAIHVVVVDPGVGTSRRGIVVETDRGILVGPDNGVMSGVFQQASILQVVELANRAYWRIANPSTTFHGRDIFAPAAAHLAGGVPIETLGPAIDANALVTLDLPPLEEVEGGLQGTIQYIDHFGNGITTIPADALRGCPQAVEVNDRVLPWQITYGEVAPGQPLALMGSHGWLEIAVNRGSAANQLTLNIGDGVKVCVESPPSPE
jgi:hypothetical protein